MGYEDVKIDELVEKIKRGAIRLPEMQRQYVWQSTRVRDLLDSLYRGYPSGTILTWDTGRGVATRDFAIDQTDLNQDNFQLLLDGQQRLTSLSAIIRGEPVRVRNRQRPIDILFNLEHPDDLQIVTEVHEDKATDDASTEDETAEANADELQKRFDQMAFVVYTRKLARLPHWVSVTAVFKEPSNRPFLSKAGVEAMDDPRYEKYTQRLNQLRSIKDYQYRVHVLERRKSYEEVTEIFVRVNSLGTKLRSSDLALAQITSKWRNSLEIFQDFEKRCREMGFDIGLPTHIRNLVAFATGQSRFRAVGSLTLDQLKKGWDDSKQGMDYALNFLIANVGIDNSILLSSPSLIIAIAFFGHQRSYNLSRDENRQLRNWALVANAKGRYSRGSTETFLDRDIAEIRKDADVSSLSQLLKTQVGRLEVLPTDLENRDRKSAYFKTMFLAFREDGAMDWRDQLVISLKHKGSTHSLQFHHIFPRAELKRQGVRPAKINDICNLSFISGRTNRNISNKVPAVYLPKIVDDIGDNALSKQCIPVERKLWEMDAYESFLEERRRLVADRLNRFLGHEE